MNTLRSSGSLLSLVFIGLTTTQLFGQVFKTVHSFNGTEGSYPFASVTLSNDTLYGTPAYGGTANKGTVFAIKSDGSLPTHLHSFTGADGIKPNSGVLVSETALYGTTLFGGKNYTGDETGNGTIFRIGTDGTGFTNLYLFSAGLGSWPNITNIDGSGPSGGLALSGQALFGVAESGGSFGSGVLFAIGTDGTGFTNLHSFAPQEGAQPNSVIISGDTLYGTTYSGISNVAGTVFAIKTDGTEFSVLHSFSNKSDGAFPLGSLTLSRRTLYGTTLSGGAGTVKAGTVFRISTDGTGYTVLHSFDGKSEGGHPQCGLALWENTLYGTTTYGVDANGGTVFALDTDGTSFTTLHTFSGGADGGSPSGRLILSGNRLSGTTYGGGAANYGTIFAFDIVISLSIVPYGSNLILAWPTHPSGFTLQSTADPANPAWSNAASKPVVVNGQNIVLEPSMGMSLFYRLVH